MCVLVDLDVLLLDAQQQQQQRREAQVLSRLYLHFDVCTC